MVGLYVASNLLIVSATRYGPATLVAATRYSAVIWAVLLDLVLFNRSPGVITMISAAAIGAFGLCLIRTERNVC
jgi:drug/metabolite transporter (DMT)-like permease